MIAHYKTIKIQMTAENVVHQHKILKKAVRDGTKSQCTKVLHKKNLKNNNIVVIAYFNSVLVTIRFAY